MSNRTESHRDPAAAEAKASTSSAAMTSEQRMRSEILSMDGPWQLDCFQNGAKIFSHMNIFLLLNAAGRVVGYQNTGTGLPISLPVEPPVPGEKGVLRPAPNPSIVAIWQRR
jgi:hypothetical protein